MTQQQWETLTPLRFRDFDYLGHMTATSYLALLEEARVDWLGQATGGELPEYVVATQQLEFHREILPADGPIRITIAARLLSPRRVCVSERIFGSRGHLHATSRAELVAWDRARRRARAFTEAEQLLFEVSEAASAASEGQATTHGTAGGS